MLIIFHRFPFLRFTRRGQTHKYFTRLKYQAVWENLSKMLKKSQPPCHFAGFAQPRSQGPLSSEV